MSPDELLEVAEREIGGDKEVPIMKRALALIADLRKSSIDFGDVDYWRSRASKEAGRADKNEGRIAYYDHQISELIKIVGAYRDLSIACTLTQSTTTAILDDIIMRLSGIDEA